MPEYLEVLPDPVRMVEGLRDTGYQFNTAVADVIDNSIAAEASFVDIDLRIDFRGNISLVIFDDGIGMDSDELINAMKYGSKTRQIRASLGKFGLGLKTASTAFCRKLTLVSKNSIDAPLLSTSWDLDHVKDSNKWEISKDVASQSESDLFSNRIGDKSGTIVVWEKVDRLLKKYSNPTSAAAKRSLLKYEDELREHLSLVFQRYLDPLDDRARNIKMILNGQILQPWDPFCVKYSQIANEAEPEVEMSDGSIVKFKMRAFILPRKEEFPNEEEAKTARISNANQGIYIYREGRLINGPDWLKMWSKEPHLSLLRVEFSFDHQLDEAFHIDIKKSQIILNEAIYDEVLNFLNPARRAAEEIYRKGTVKKNSGLSINAHIGSNRNIESKAGNINQPNIVVTDPTKDEASVTNNQGTFRIKLKITNPTNPAEIFVQPVEGILEGLLWEPSLNDSKIGVRINTAHDYYNKVYVPNLNEGVTVQGMDALLWALCVAELYCLNDSNKDMFKEMRYEVSKILRKLVEDLPDPKSEN